MMKKPFECPHDDCFAYEKRGCKALQNLYDDLAKCKFYKSKLDNSNQIKAIKERKRRELRFGKNIDF